MFSAAQRPLIIGQVLGILLYAFDELAINTIMPFISNDLNGDQLYGAAFAFYMIGTLLSVVWAGDRLDREGPMLPLIAAITAFSIGLIVAASASSMIAFVLARLLQGIGGGALYTVLFSLTAHCYSEAQRPRVIGILSAAWIIPAMLGPVTAGWLQEAISWRAVFYLQLPLLLIALSSVYFALQRFDFSPTGSDPRRRTMILAVVIASLVTLATLSFSYGGSITYLLLALVLMTTALIGIRAIAPLSMRIQRSPQAMLVSVRGLVHFSFYAADVMIPLVLVREYGYSASEAGLVLVVGAVGWTIASAVVAARDIGVSRRSLIIGGNLILALGILGSITILSFGLSALIFIITWLLVGAGMGLIYNSASAQLMDGAPKDQIGKTSTVASMSDAMGVTLASGIAGYLINSLELLSATTILWTIALVGCLTLALLTPSKKAFEQPLPT